MADADYIEESIACAFDALGCYPIWEQLTAEQRKQIGESVEVSLDNYSTFKYTPPSSDRISEVEREWKVKYDQLRKEFDEYITASNTAVKRVAGLPSWAQVSIDKYGQATRIDR